MHALRDRAARWAEQHHPEELEQSIRHWLGPHSPDDRLFMEGVAYALVTGNQDGQPSLIERHSRANPPASRRERQLYEAWRTAWFGVFELLSVAEGKYLILEDVVTGAVFSVRENSASLMLSPGQWGLFFIVCIDGRHELEGTALLLSPTGRIAAVQAMLAGLQELGKGPDADALSPADTRRLAPGVVAAARQAERRPRFVNRDGHDLALVRATLTLPWAAFADATEPWADIVHHDSDTATWIGRHDSQLGGPLSLASFSSEGPDGGVAVVQTNSIERLDVLRQHWLERTGGPLPVVEDELEIERVDSNPDGPAVQVDQSLASADDRSQQDAEYGFHQHLAQDWLNHPIPALNGQSPRQAVHAGRAAEVRALLPTALPEDLLWELREELDL